MSELTSHELVIEGDKGNNVITLNEFVIYSSPRYYRLIFNDLKPITKSGDLISALGEMKRERFITPDSDWDRIKLTKKGGRFRKLIKIFLDIEALKVPQSTGIFDYRSEQGRKVIVELIRFLAARLNFSEYSKRILQKFGYPPVENIDFSSEQGRMALEEFLKQFKSKSTPTVSPPNKSVFQQPSPILFNTNLIKKYLISAGLNRPEPLFNHFNLAIPKLFEVRERQFSVFLPELRKIISILEEYLSDFHKDENKWLADYFQLLGLPTTFFGFHVNEFSYASKEMDAFVTLAMLGPKIFAQYFTQTLKDVGEVEFILFPVNPQETITISCSMWDIMYYFTLPTEQCLIKLDIQFNSQLDFPDMYASSIGMGFGRLVTRSDTIGESQRELVKSDKTIERDQRKILDEQWKLRSDLIDDGLKNLAQYSASFFSVCQAIAQKFTPGFWMPKLFCVFHNGVITLTKFSDSKHILTQISMGKPQFSSDLQKILKKVNDSMSQILDFASDDNNESIQNQ